MKTFEILISEEVAYRYRIKADNMEQAEGFAMDNHTEQIEANKIAESIDRCEIIESKEIDGGLLTTEDRALISNFIVHFTSDEGLRNRMSAVLETSFKEYMEE